MNKKIFYLSSFILLCLALTNCNRQPAVSPNAKKFDLKGKIVAVDKGQQLLTIAHEDIKDYMPGMTMEFKVRDAWVFDIAKPGDEITAAYIVDGASSWLEEVVIKEGTEKADAAGVAGTEPKVGDEIPNYRLINQDGKAIRIHDYKGKTLLLTFIFTRCQDPQQCTLMSTR